MRGIHVRLPLAVMAVALLGACAVIAPVEVGPATWAFAPNQEIGPDTTEFVAMVTERDCASGQSSQGRIVGPEIEMTEESVVVTFAVRRPPGEVHACPGNPPTAVSVALDAPLGDRLLLDGGREPPAEPPSCANPESCE